MHAPPQLRMPPSHICPLAMHAPRHAHPSHAHPPATHAPGHTCRMFSELAASTLCLFLQRDNIGILENYSFYENEQNGGPFVQLLVIYLYTIMHCY